MAMTVAEGPRHPGTGDRHASAGRPTTARRRQSLLACRRLAATATCAWWRASAALRVYPFSFAFAGDSGAWPDPTADAIFGQLVSQMEALRPAPLFFANLGDFAGPG